MDSSTPPSRLDSLLSFPSVSPLSLSVSHHTSICYLSPPTTTTRRAGVVEVPNARAQGHSHCTRHAHAHSGSVGVGTGVLSKHAQVQLLEAAAILSHLSPDSETGTSLPEDRGMWPRWVSGGALEGEDDVPGSVPASVSSAYGYPSSVGGGGYSVGGAARTGVRAAGGCVSVQSPTPVTRPAPFRSVEDTRHAACPPPSASPPTLPVAHTSGAALEGEDDVPGSVPASVSSANGYPSVGGGGYSVGGGSEYGSAGWWGMRQCTIAYTSDPPRPVARRRGYAARSLPAPIGIPADSPRRPHELTVRPALSPRRFEGRVGSSRRECPPFAQGSAWWRSASPVVSSYARAPTSAPPHTAHTTVGIKLTNIYTPQSQ
ncbi:hypothetical protein B0H14DRAFT_3471333 [Mycena olivaceomarginata]|nr:hypothetical protein B0H14DRAFT_3471333 [Mycena olivaceomarginata]